jgi:hypothetical protein
MQKLVFTEKREIRGAQKLENIRNKIECGDLSYAGWLCVLEERPVGLRHGVTLTFSIMFGRKRNDVAWSDYDPKERRMVWLTLRNDIQRKIAPTNDCPKDGKWSG